MDKYVAVKGEGRTVLPAAMAAESIGARGRILPNTLLATTQTGVVAGVPPPSSASPMAPQTA